MAKRRYSFTAVLRQLVRSLRDNDEYPKSHADALMAYVHLARRSVPSRGIFAAGRHDDDVLNKIEGIANRQLGFASARARFVRTVNRSGLPFENKEAILSAANEFQDVSDTAYFYAGLASALAFISYGDAFATIAVGRLDASRREATRGQLRRPRS